MKKSRQGRCQDGFEANCTLDDDSTSDVVVHRSSTDLCTFLTYS